MKNILNKIKNELLTIYIAINILYIFIFSYLVIICKFKYILFGRSLIYAFILNLIVSIITLVYYKFFKKKYKLKICDILLVVITILLIISLMFAVNFKVALYGSTNRYEGIFALLYYLSLFFLCSFINKDSKKIIAYIIILTGVFQGVFALLQITQSPMVDTVKFMDQIWAIGFTNNPNFLGSYMLLCLSITYGLLYTEKKTFTKLILFLISIILLSGLIVSNTLSCLVGLVGVLILLLVYSVKKKQYKEFILIVFTVGFLLYFFQVGELTNLLNDVVKTTDESVEITKGNVSGDFGTKRIEIWKKTLKIVPKYWLHGVGIDSFLLAFGDGPLYIKNLIYDKAHNEYLQILVTEGVFTLISYLSLYGIVVLDGLKKMFKKDNLCFLLPVVGYLIQAFFNISVIEVAPIFFITLGLLVERRKINE